MPTLDNAGKDAVELKRSPVPTISVVIPTFNRAKLIAKVVSSIEAQILPPTEVIIVDDCSTDDTETVCRALQSSIPIVFKRLERNGGGGVARNAGIQLAKGDYIAFLDSDDEWDSTHLRTLASRAIAMEGHLVVASSALVSGTGRVFPKGSWARATSIAEKLHFVLEGNLAFQTSTLLMPRSTALKFMFDGRLRRHQDWDLIFRVIEGEVDLFLLPEPTTIYHPPSGTNVSRSSSVVPSLRFLARHRAAMSRKSIARFTALEVHRRRADHLSALKSLIKAVLVGGLSIREFVFYVLLRLRALAPIRTR